MSSHQQEADTPISNDLVIAEYTALREELLKLVDIQHQLITLTLLSFGTLVGASVPFNNTSIILTYPIIATFLAAGWFNHAYGIDMLGHYIQEHIENIVGTRNIGWENYSRKISIPHTLVAFLGARGIFVVTQVIALITGVFGAAFNKPLFLLALLSTIVSILLLVGTAWAQKGRKRLTESQHNAQLENARIKWSPKR
jgi:hypothetical protein